MKRAEALAALRRLEESVTVHGAAWFAEGEELSTEELRLRTLVAWRNLERGDLRLIHDLIETLERPTVEGILDFIRAVEDQIRERLGEER